MENVCSHKEVTRDPPSLLCRKIFCYAENFLIMQKVFCYAEKLCRKFSVMQKNYAKSFLVCRKIFFDYNKKKINSGAKEKKKKKSFKHEPFTKTMFIVD